LDAFSSKRIKIKNMTQISKHLTLEELCHSEAAIKLGIVNVPNQLQTENLKALALKVYEPVREHFGVEINISSGYRIMNLNQALKGNITSQHSRGEAIDIDMKGDKVTNAQVFHWIKDNLKYDQLIWEFGDNKNPNWIHVSYCKDNRQQTLRTSKVDGITKIQKF
jgi:zinc D-Ala-D-Ala carboxypeptidase